jgi:formamidase
VTAHALAGKGFRAPARRSVEKRRCEYPEFLVVRLHSWSSDDSWSSAHNQSGDLMPQVVFPLDSTKKFTEQQIVGHNRWHWAIPAQVQVKPGDTFRVHCREWFDGAIHNDDSAEDILNAPLPSVHVLSGPIAVQGARPGDLLIVDILDVGPIPQEDSGPLAGQGWGYTGVFATKNGGGFLTEQFPDAYKVIWDFQGGVATSRHVPGVSFTGIVHPGLMGTAPSAELLAKWNAREQVLIDTDPDRVPPLALPPLPDSAILGSLSGEEFERAAAEAARTAPPRENGGNQDIKNFTKGTRVFYPVFVDGANVSMGDLHFSQGDGEITFCGAIEMGGFIDLHVDLIKGGMETYGVSENAIFMPGTTDPQFSRWLAFSGTSVTLDGVQHYLDSHLSYQRACLHAIDYLSKFGYSRIQAYMILGSAPIEGRLSGVVDIPNSCSTVYIPTEIFDIDVRPSAKGPAQIDPGMGVPVASAGA